MRSFPLLAATLVGAVAALYVTNRPADTTASNSSGTLPGARRTIDAELYPSLQLSLIHI